MSEKVQQTETGNALQRFLKRKTLFFGKTLWNRRVGRDGAGIVCIAFDRYNYRNAGRADRKSGAGGRRRLCKSVAGPAMAISIGYALQAPQLVLFSLLAVGAAANSLGGAGGPLAVLIVAIVAAECGKAVSKETKIDILVTPLVTILSGVLLSMWCAPTIGAAASAVGSLIMWATELQPFFMGILVSVIVGVALTLPISSAAICAALNLTGLAGGAAVAGCCAQMVGFAAMSFKENKWSGLISQGLGTSMLQMGNIVKIRASGFHRRWRQPSPDRLRPVCSGFR